MNGATLAVLQVQWERAWMAEDFDQVSRIDQARRVIEGLAVVRPEEAAPMSETETSRGGANRFEDKPAEQVRETAPPQRFQLDRRMFVRLALFHK